MVCNSGRNRCSSILYPDYVAQACCNPCCHNPAGNGGSRPVCPGCGCGCGCGCGWYNTTCGSGSSGSSSESSNCSCTCDNYGCICTCD